MIIDVGKPFGADQLQGKKGKKVLQGRDRFAPGKSGVLDHLGQVEPFDERSEQEHPGRVTVYRLGLADIQDPRDFRNAGPLDGESYFEPAAAWQLRVSLFGQNPFDGSHRDLDAFFGEQLGDLTGGESVFAPGADFLTCGHVHCPTVDLAFGDGFGKIDLVVGELMSEQVDVGRGVAEAVCDDGGGESVDKGSPERLIAALPVVFGAEEEAFIGHAALICIGVKHVK